MSECWAKPLFATPCDFYPRGIPDPAHIGFTKQFLKQRGLDKEQVWDERIVRPVCRKHHALLDGPYFHLFIHQLPASVLDYADEHGIRWRLEQNDQRNAATTPNEGSDQ